MKKRESFLISPTLLKFIFILIGVLCLSPWISPPIALLLGIVFAQLGPHPFAAESQKYTSILLKLSVIGLGFGMKITEAVQAGKQGILFTVGTIFFTLLIGFLLGKFLKVEKITSYLIAGGTAICGGSAIAALSPVIKAKQEQISVALGVIFILNALALFIFPYVGTLLNMNQTDFGIWSAIAIHDTSSVVGAAAKYGDQALQTATTLKLARALWIIPVAFISTLLFKSKGVKIQIPYFIGLFIVAIFLNSYLPFLDKISPHIVTFSKRALTLTLFLIGTGLSHKMLKTVGLRPIFLGSILWILISIGTLLLIIYK